MTSSDKIDRIETNRILAVTTVTGLIAKENVVAFVLLTGLLYLLFRPCQVSRTLKVDIKKAATAK